jgi:hypothetical protein
MIFLYTALLLLLGVARYWSKYRAASLERKYVRVAREADGLLKTSRGGTNYGDPVQAAKRQYLLGCLAQKRDRVEAKYTAWQAKSDRLGKWFQAVRNWKGQKLPYTFGILDLYGALYLIDYLGASTYANPRYLFQVVASLFTN